MVSVVNHGITQFDYEGLQAVVKDSVQIASSVYERKEYMQARQGEQKEITEKCAEWYKHSSYAYKIKNDKFNSFFKDDFFTKFNMKKDPVDISVFRFLPGQFTPPHVDNMGAYKAMHDVNDDDIVRLWIALSKPDLGHALFIGKKQVIYNVPRGTTLQFDFRNEWHSGVNAGIKDRYFITVTGVRNGK